MYDIRYLPLAEDDLDEIVTYFLEKLIAPQAARRFLKRVDEVVDVLREHPFTYRVYDGAGPLEYEIRSAPINNFLMFYTVLDDMVEIHRVLYGRRDISNLVESEI